MGTWQEAVRLPVDEDRGQECADGRVGDPGHPGILASGQGVSGNRLIDHHQELWAGVPHVMVPGGKQDSSDRAAEENQQKRVAP